jgi:cyclic beta-1,2-glucan synthetase
VSEETGTLYEHCVRGLKHSLTKGPHGLPLFGTGDWNDAMNRVGHEGKGESVWLGWFIHATVTAFLPHVEARDPALAEKWRKYLNRLASSLENHAWDGAWYRRGYFDDGTPMGTASAEECRIDSLAQSWAVIARAGDGARAKQAILEAERQLIRPSDRIAMLFTPAFDKTPLDPGYIKGYPPGIRENGGQYTHAACWMVVALAQLGMNDKAHKLLHMLNPINYSSTLAGAQRYRTEPYVVAADVYSAPAHVGQAGWTWYTGSAGWLYQAGLQAILGLEQRGEELYVTPCIPPEWEEFEFTVQRGKTRYEIKVVRKAREDSTGAAAEGARPRQTIIRLADDGQTHRIQLIIGKREIVKEPFAA